ncbi:SprT-like domain-containing protein Spartan [Diplonema papillatum]|nr:SprT-like domain-containing protein Spartan [Diplonema papillatum]
MAGVDLELLDPCPDVHALFVRYKDELFDGKLGSVYVEWSKRMTLCAGTRLSGARWIAFDTKHTLVVWPEAPWHCGRKRA